jgi:hypothetical protein
MVYDSAFGCRRGREDGSVIIRVVDPLHLFSTFQQTVRTTGWCRRLEHSCRRECECRTYTTSEYIYLKLNKKMLCTFKFKNDNPLRKLGGKPRNHHSSSSRYILNEKKLEVSNLSNMRDGEHSTGASSCCIAEKKHPCCLRNVGNTNVSRREGTEDGERTT